MRENNNSSRDNNNSHHSRGPRNGVAALPKNPHTDGPVPPSRTLFIRNVQFDTLESDITQKLEPFGDIKDTFNLISKRGLIFVTFYDLRSSENAMAALQDITFNGRKADIHYSIPKEGDKPEKSQASILVDCNETILTHALFEYMAKFGEIRSIRDHSPEPLKKIVSYWDSRACVRAIDAITENPAYGQNGKLNAIMFWDEGQERFADKVNNSSNSRGDRDRNNHRSDQRNRTRDRSLSPTGARRRDNGNNSRDRDRSRERDRRGGNDRSNYRNDDRRRDRDSGVNDYYPNQPSNNMQQPPLNLMDILSQSKATMQPPIINNGFGFNQPMSFPGQIPNQTQNAPNNLLASLLQGQTAGGIQPNQVQQLMSLLSQMAPQQPQQLHQGYSGQSQPQQSQQGYSAQNQPQQPQQSYSAQNQPQQSQQGYSAQNQQQYQQPTMPSALASVAPMFRGYSSQTPAAQPHQYASQQQAQTSYLPQNTFNVAPQDPRLNPPLPRDPRLSATINKVTSPALSNPPPSGSIPSLPSASINSNSQSAPSNLQNLAALLMQTKK